MNREEFINELRIALQGQISQARVNEHLRYYENYIIDESRKGRSEQEVIAALGNPRWIAKTIIETEGNKVYQDTQMEHYKENERSGDFKTGTWHRKLIMCLILCCVIFCIARLAVALLPIILPILILFFIFHLLFSGKYK